MRKFTLVLATMLGILAASSAKAAITLNFGPNVGSTIQFVGTGTSSTFNLQPQTNPQFTVTSVNGGDNSGLGVLGSIISSTGFTYNAADITPNGAVGQQAPLSGSGTLTLSSATETVTGTITGVEIMTSGGGAIVNPMSVINLTGLTLTGSGNADLTTFYQNAVANGGIGLLTFQFTEFGATTTLLTDLLSGTHSTSYSGTLTAVPEPATLASAIVGLGLLGGLGWLRRRRNAD